MPQPTSGDFTKTAGWLDWYSGPSTPKFKLPDCPTGYCGWGSRL